MKIPITILVVENISLIRLDIAERLLEAGFNTVEASTADEAIQVLESRCDIQIVMTEIEMPGTMDGLALAHFIRKRWPPTVLIVNSAAPIPDQKHLPLGATFLRKPFEHSALIDHLAVVGDHLRV